MIHQAGEFAILSLGLGGRESQDAYYVSPREDGTIVLSIADGVGGSSDGRRSSQTAIAQIAKWADSGDTNIGLPFAATHTLLKKFVAAEAQLDSLATTLTTVIMENGLVTYGHVGDCRIYLMRGDGLRTVTRDQTELAQLLAEGILTKQRAKNYRRANVLTSALGSSTTYEFAAGHFEINRGDRIVLCSDGVYKSLSKRDLVALSLESKNAIDLCKKMEERFIKDAPKDDATAIVVDV